ncbi:MAG: hypothetical protein WDN69_19465 [Aliidongia sp.]
MRMRQVEAFRAVMMSGGITAAAAPAEHHPAFGQPADRRSRI